MDFNVISMSDSLFRRLPRHVGVDKKLKHKLHRDLIAEPHKSCGIDFLDLASSKPCGIPRRTIPPWDKMAHQKFTM